MSAAATEQVSKSEEQFDSKSIGFMRNWRALATSETHFDGQRFDKAQPCIMEHHGIRFASWMYADRTYELVAYSFSDPGVCWRLASCVDGKETPYIACVRGIGGETKGTKGYVGAVTVTKSKITIVVKRYVENEVFKTYTWELGWADRQFGVEAAVKYNERVQRLDKQKEKASLLPSASMMSEIMKLRFAGDDDD